MPTTERLAKERAPEIAQAIQAAARGSPTEAQFRRPVEEALAQFASKHVFAFRRIELIRLHQGSLKRLDVNNEKNRTRVLGATGNQHLDSIFEELP